jgi:hypothetical protein
MTRPTPAYPLLAGALLLLSMSCSGDHPVAPDAGRVRLDVAVDPAAGAVTMCHHGDEDAFLLELPTASRAGHESHGDYVAHLSVDAAGAEGDGIHFRRIGDAVAAARATRVAQGEQRRGACRITIDVAAGLYRGGIAPAGPGLEQFPIVIDVPDVTLHGAFDMVLDGDGRATGASATGAASTLAAVPPLLTIGQYSEPIVFVDGDPNGFRGDGVVIEGFWFQAGHGGTEVVGGAAIISLRVTDLVIRLNRFDGGFSESIDLRASDGRVERNHRSGGGGTCDICLAGPGVYHAEGNRTLAGGIPGILIVPATLIPVPPGIVQYQLPAAATVTATVVNNEVRDHLKKPVGAGIRVAAIGVNAPNVAGTSRVAAHDNVLINNNFAMIVEGGFPVVNTLRRGDVDLALGGNTFLNSCQNDFLVSLSRHTTGLGITNAPYLLNSSYSLTLAGDIAWEDVWYAHPAGFGNALTVDGVPIAHGNNTAFDPALTCSP